MESRNQMTFYISFWEAINGLSKKDQLPVFRAVISYGLFGETGENLTATQSAFFSLIKPVLDAARKKASNGKQKGSKAKANGKQNGKEIEEEVEKELEIELEDECLTRTEWFERFWGNYPNAVGKTEAFSVWKTLSLDSDLLRAVFDGLSRWKRSKEWRKDSGKYIPRPAKWLMGLRWEDHPPEDVTWGATGELGTAEVEAIHRMFQNQQEE